jgi:hypothetical protein
MTSGSDLRGEARGIKPAAEMAARNGRVRLRLQIPRRHLEALEKRIELKPTQHIQVAVTKLLAAKPRPALPADVQLGDPDDAQQVWIDQSLATRLEDAYGGTEHREAAILMAIARYLEER